MAAAPLERLELSDFFTRLLLRNWSGQMENETQEEVLDYLRLLVRTGATGNEIAAYFPGIGRRDRERLRLVYGFSDSDEDDDDDDDDEDEDEEEDEDDDDDDDDEDEYSYSDESE